MSEFKKLVIDGINQGYYNSHKLSNNQTINIYFLRFENYKSNEYSVVLAISNKRKHIKQWLLEERDALTNKETGNCGLEGLIWAKRQIKYFERFLYKRIGYYENNGVTISVYWSDSKRRIVYEYALGKLGFKLGMRYQKTCLYKQIVRDRDINLLNCFLCDEWEDEDYCIMIDGQSVCYDCKEELN
jgi:hypothetical protein